MISPDKERGEVSQKVGPKTIRPFPRVGRSRREGEGDNGTEWERGERLSTAAAAAAARERVYIPFIPSYVRTTHES